MKKALKITGIVLAALVALAIAAVMFTGIVQYIIISKFVSPMDNIVYSEWPNYDAGTLTEYKTVSYKPENDKAAFEMTISADIPVDMLGKLDEDGNRGAYTDRVFITDGAPKGNCATVFFTGSHFTEPPKITDDDRAKGVSEKDIDDFCTKELGKQPIRSYYDMLDVIYSADTSKCNVLSKKETTFYMLFGTYRAVLCSEPDEEIVYHFEKENIRGFITEYKNEQYSVYVNVFDRNDLNTEYSILVSAPDKETVYKIVNSIRLETE